MSSFPDKQREYYLRELNRALPVSGGPDTAALNAALGITDPDVPNAPGEASRIFGAFTDTTGAHERDTKCRNLHHPHGMRDPGAAAGCGWWYVQDPNTPSSGAYGSRRGPMSQPSGNGSWIWDVANAERMEGLKQAARVATCPDIQYSRYPNMGWCTQTQRAIVTDGHGNPAFPGAMGGDCPQGSIVTRAENCPRPPPPAPNTPAPPVPSNSIAGLCQSGSGTQSPQCLQTIANAACSPAGTLSQSLGGGYAGSSSSVVTANQYLNQRGFSIHPGIMNNGSVSIADAIASVTSLRELANVNDGSRYAAAAQNLCFGIPFNACQYNGTDTGPFLEECITEACVAAGWSLKGALIPANAPAGTWSKFQNWAEVVQFILWAKQVADKPGMTPNPADQITAIMNVYGTTIKPPRSGCNNAGIFMYRYFFPTMQQALFTTNGPLTHFLGRYLFKDGFPQKAPTTEDQTPAGGFANEGQRYITIFTPTQGGTYQFMIGHGDGARMFVDDALLLDWQPCCGNTPTPTVQMTAGTSYKLTVDFWHGGGAWAFMVLTSVNGGQWAPIPTAQLTTPVDRRLPFLEYDFSKAPSDAPALGDNVPVTDTNGIFQQMYRYAAPIGKLGGQQALLINNPQSVNSQSGGNPSGLFNFLVVAQGARIRAIKSFTMRVYVSSVNAANGLSPTLFSMFNLPESVTTTLPPRTLQPNFVQAYTNRVNDFSIGVSGSGAIAPMGRAPGVSGNVFGGKSQMIAPLGTWNHIAWVWADDFSSYAIYLNGKLQYNAGLGAAVYDPTLIAEQIRIGCDNHAEGASWSGGISWFRAFDYSLSPAQVAIDNANNWTSL
jgi:hypothetical protein